LSVHFIIIDRRFLFRLKNALFTKKSFILGRIVNIKLDIRIVNIKKENNNKYLVILDGKDMRFLIGEKGNTLNSFEYLLSTTRQFKNIKIVVDSNNYKEKREKSLRDLARKKGKAVLATGNAIKLNPMSARERKIIHEEVSFMKGLQTESVGEEPKRYLVIKKLDEKTFGNISTKETYSKTLNKSGSYTLTIKPAQESKQFVIDNIKWTK